jgi:hypothetical protein
MGGGMIEQFIDASMCALITASLLAIFAMIAMIVRNMWEDFKK